MGGLCDSVARRRLKRRGQRPTPRTAHEAGTERGHLVRADRAAQVQPHGRAKCQHRPSGSVWAELGAGQAADPDPRTGRRSPRRGVDRGFALPWRSGRGWTAAVRIPRRCGTRPERTACEPKLWRTPPEGPRAKQDRSIEVQGVPVAAKTDVGSREGRRNRAPGGTLPARARGGLAESRHK